MGYKADLDYDNDRLPHGMSRVGYDERTQIYTYRDSDGSYWQGPPGSRYGTLYRVSKAAAPRLSSFSARDDGDEEEADETPAYPASTVRPHNRHPNSRFHRLSGTTIASDNDTDADTFSYSYSFPDTDYDEKNPIPSPPPTPLKRSGTLSRLTRFRMSPLSAPSISLPRCNLDPSTALTIHPSPLLSHPAFQTRKELNKTNKETNTTKVSVSSPPSASRSRQQRPNQPLSRRATVTAAEPPQVGRGYEDGYAGRGARRQSYQAWARTDTQAGSGGGVGNGVGNGVGAGAGGGAPVVRRKRATTFDEILAGF